MPGKLETRYRCSNTIGWDTSRSPNSPGKWKVDLTRCAEGYLAGSGHHFPATIADLYDPTTCPPTCVPHVIATTKCWYIYISRRFKERH